MDLLVTVFLLFPYILVSLKIANAATFDIRSYGAKGDGITDDSQAFLRAWDALCADGSINPTLIIPSEMTFLIGPMVINGSSCTSANLNVKLLGKITAPTTLAGWKDCYSNKIWIYITTVRGLTIDGPGLIDGQGAIWWGNKQEMAHQTCDRPSALHFHACSHLRLKDTTHINSPFLHISFNGCQDVDVENLRIIAPQNSPNTDGIDISDSSHVNIHDSNIQTGDDCVAVNGGVYDVNVTNVHCGPGHGISIGSLGEDGPHDTVEQVTVRYCNITGTQNGLRIKTVPNGSGYARGIIFEHINLINVQNPIIINQQYCLKFENHICPPSPAEAVQVSNVRYTNIYGSSASKQAITFDCSPKYKCTGIVMNGVHITGGDDFAYCSNVEGEFIDTIPSVSCN